MDALACCEIREEEDGGGQRVSGAARSLGPALAESTAALAEMTRRLGAGDAVAARVAEFVDTAVGDVAPPAAAPPPLPPSSHAEVMARLDALAAQEEAAGARAQRARATGGGAGWRGGFLDKKTRPGPAAPDPKLDSTPAAAALMRRGPRARGGPSAAPPAAPPGPVAAPQPAQEAQAAWKHGFLDRRDAPAARVATAAAPPVGRVAPSSNRCVRRVVERPADAGRSRPPVFDNRPPGAPLPPRAPAPAAGESLFAREHARGNSKSAGVSATRHHMVLDEA